VRVRNPPPRLTASQSTNLEHSTSLTDVTEGHDEDRATGNLPGVLVGPSWLQTRLTEADLRIVDLRDLDGYSGAHIPGAVQLDLAQLGTTGDTGLDNVLLPPADFARLMESLGIGSGDTVVAYDDQWGLAAARLVWALHFYGHAAAAILDGGWDRWRDESRPATDDVPKSRTADFRPAVNEGTGADLAWLTVRLSDPELALLDTRTHKEFAEGHLPDALSWDWFNAVPPGSWDCARDPEELRDEWEALGIGPTQEIVVYCRSGMRAAHTYVVLKHAGYPRVRLYDGSWQEWSVKV